MLPVQVLVLAEGAEEVGSPGFGAVVRRLARRLRPRAVVVSDTERHGDGTPTVTLSQRGRIAARLEVDTGGPACTRGGWAGGGDPSLVLAEALLLLRTELIPALGVRTSAPVDDGAGAKKPSVPTPRWPEPRAGGRPPGGRWTSGSPGVARSA